MSKKREAEREAWKERKQALNNIQQKNDELYALRIVDLDKHPLLQGITNTKEYKKVHRQLQNAALTQDIWAEGFTLNNNSSNLNVSLNQESSALKQDVLPVVNNYGELEWGGPISIKIGGSKITVNTKEEADRILEELSKNTPSYNQDKYQESLNNLKSILYTGKGNTKMHSNIMLLLSNLSRLQTTSSNIDSSANTTIDNGVKSETDKTPTLWNAIIQNAYGGKYDPDIILSGVDTRDYNTRFEIYKNAIKLIDPTIITEGKTEDQINNELFNKGLFDRNAAGWLLGAPDYDTKGVVKKEEEIVYDPYVGNIYQLYIHPNYKLLGSDENGEGGYGDYFKDQGIILVENNSGQVHVLDINKLDSTNKYYALKDLSGADYTFNTLGYDKNFVKDNVMLFKDSQGNYRIGKIGDPGFTKDDHKAIRDYLNRGILEHSEYKDSYIIGGGDEKKINNYYETIFKGKTGQVDFIDITGYLPDLGPEYNNYYAILTDFSKISPDGKFFNTPFILFNPETNDIKERNITTLPNGYYLIRDYEGNIIAEGDGRKNFNLSWYLPGFEKKVELINSENTNRLFRLKNEDLNYPPIDELLDDGRYDNSMFVIADAHSNNPNYYAEYPDKVKNIALTILKHFKDTYNENADKHKKQYAYFALQVLTLAGGAEYLKNELGFSDNDITTIYKRLEEWVYEPVVESNKQGGILKAQQGLTILQKRALEEEYFSNKKEKEEKQLSLNEINLQYRNKKRIDFSSNLNSGDDKGATWDDYVTLGLDAISTVASFVPGVGTGISAVCGIAATGIELGADLSRGDESAWKDFGVNMAFTILGLIPGLKAGKLVKGTTKLMNVAEYAKDAKKYTAGAEKVLNLSEKTIGKANVDLPELKTIINNAKDILHQTDNVLNNKGLLESTAQSIWNGTKSIVDFSSKILAGASLVNGAASTVNIIKDASSGEAPDVYDLKGILGGVSGFSALRANALNSLAKKSLKQLGATNNQVKTIKGKIYSGNNQQDIDIEITPGMNKSSVNDAIKTKAILMREDANVKIQSLEAKKSDGKTIDEEELIKVKSLYNKLNTILTDTKFGGKSAAKISFDESDLKFNDNTSGHVLDDRFNKKGFWLEKQGYKWAEKRSYLTDSEYSQLSDDVTKELDDLLKIIDELENSSDLKVNIKNGEKIIDLLNALKSARIQLPVQQLQVQQTVQSLQPVQLSLLFKKGGQLYNSKEVDSLVNLKKKDVTKYQTPAGPITIGNLKLTNLDFYKDYNAELILYYDELAKNGQLTPEKVEELNKLFSDKQALNAWAKSQGYDGSKAIRHGSGNVKAYLDQYHNLGLHTNSFKTGWDKNYSNSSFNDDSNDLTNSELWNQNGTFRSDDDFGEKTYHRNANYMTDEELAKRNAIWENTGYKWELMEGSEVGEDGRKFYNIVPLSTDPKRETELTEDYPTDISLTSEKPEYSRPKGFSWAPFKAGADIFLDYQANKDILESSYQDAPPGRNYVNVYKKVTDNFISRWMAAKNAGELNAQAAFLANNTADIDKANAIKLQGYKQGLDATYDAMMRSYDEYKRTSTEQEDLRRKYDLQNNEIKYQNDMQLYLNKLINKNRFVQFLNANKASRRNALNYLDSRLIEEQKAYTDLHNRDLMAVANRNKSIALTMAENDYYNSLKETENVDIEFNNYLKEWKNDPNNNTAYAKGDIPTMDSIIPGSNPPETFNQRKQRILANAIVLFKNKQNIALADFDEAKNYTLPFINHLYQWVPDISKPYRYEQGGSLDFKEKKELLRLKSGYQQLRETVKDILKSIDNGEKQLDRISSGLSKERLLLLKNMLK